MMIPITVRYNLGSDLRNFARSQSNRISHFLLSKCLMSIFIFVTGGTFDKEYDMINGKLYFDETHIPEMLDLGRCPRH